MLSYSSDSCNFCHGSPGSVSYTHLDVYKRQQELEGYEIHMGETVLKGEAGHSVSIEDQVSGECKEDGAYCKNVCGTYVHGVFDREDVAEAVVRVLGEKKGIDVSQMTGIDFAAFKETQYDILAAELRKHLDMKKIYEILEQGI